VTPTGTKFRAITRNVLETAVQVVYNERHLFLLAQQWTYRFLFLDGSAAERYGKPPSDFAVGQ